MSDVQPFRAIRFQAPPGGDLSGVIAPPYDVLSEADKAALLTRDPHNIVAVDLPHTPPKSAGPAEAYQRAGELLRTWLTGPAARLVRESAPAVYPYRQVLHHAGRPVERRGFIARVRAEQFRASPAGIFPHEQTFSGPKEDRLMLMRATHCQLSPIFGLFADEGNRITDSLYADLPAAPLLTGRLGDVRHEVWRVDQAGQSRKIAALTAALADRPIFIADGHHRYTTALNYLAELERQEPNLPADHPARFVMFVLVSMHDPGLAIQPTHRVLTVRRFDPVALTDKLKEAFEVQCLALAPEQLEAEVLRRGPGWFGVKSANAHGPQSVGTGAGESLLLRLVDPNVLDRFEPNRGQAWRRLDVAVLHRFLIQEALTPLAGEPVGIEYPHNGRDMAAALASGTVDAATAFGSDKAKVAKRKQDSTIDPGSLTKVAFIMAPTPLAAVREVCLSGELMPQKSTFFYPKLATGLTLYDLAE